MKLAEALQERADLIRKIAQLGSRINDNALVQEGEKPNEDPKAMLAELRSCVTRLEKLIAAINYPNFAVKVDGVTLTQMIAPPRSVMPDTTAPSKAETRTAALLPTASLRTMPLPIESL